MKYFGACETFNVDQGKLNRYIVMEWMEGGSLLNWLKSKDKKSVKPVELLLM